MWLISGHRKKAGHRPTTTAVPQIQPSRRRRALSRGRSRFAEVVEELVLPLADGASEGVQLGDVVALHQAVPVVESSLGRRPVGGPVQVRTRPCPPRRNRGPARRRRRRRLRSGPSGDRRGGGGTAAAMEGQAPRGQLPPWFSFSSATSAATRLLAKPLAVRQGRHVAPIKMTTRPGYGHTTQVRLRAWPVTPLPSASTAS